MDRLNSRTRPRVPVRLQQLQDPGPERTRMGKHSLRRTSSMCSSNWPALSQSPGRANHRASKPSRRGIPLRLTTGQQRQNNGKNTKTQGKSTPANSKKEPKICRSCKKRSLRSRKNPSDGQRGDANFLSIAPDNVLRPCARVVGDVCICVRVLARFAREIVRRSLAA
jgi:hypothetical protein